MLPGVRVACNWQLRLYESTETRTCPSSPSAITGSSQVLTVKSQLRFRLQSFQPNNLSLGPIPTLDSSPTPFAIGARGSSFEPKMDLVSGDAQSQSSGKVSEAKAAQPLPETDHIVGSEISGKPESKYTESTKHPQYQGFIQSIC